MVRRSGSGRRSTGGCGRKKYPTGVSVARVVFELPQRGQRLPALPFAELGKADRQILLVRAGAHAGPAEQFGTDGDAGHDDEGNKLQVVKGVGLSGLKSPDSLTG
jgi:hypothetical protein